MQAVPSEYLAINRKKRAHEPFLELDLRPAEERVCDFNEVVISFSPEEAQIEAARCIHCPDPAPCMVACPTHNDIPSAMWLIEKGKFSEAAKLYHNTSSLPEICADSATFWAVYAVEWVITVYSILFSSRKALNFSTGIKFTS